MEIFPLHFLIFKHFLREAAEAKAAQEQTQAASSLPAEPSADCGAPLANIRFRAPSTQLQRRFLASDSLEILLLFLRSEGFRPEEYKVGTLTRSQWD